MPRTQAIYYRDARGVEPVNRFIEALSPKRAAKVDAYVEEHLNDRPSDAPPPEFPLSSQIEGELRELRVRFGNTRYRLLYQRSGNLVVLLHAFEKNAGAVPGGAKALAKRRMTDFQRRMDEGESHREQRVEMRLLAIDAELDLFIDLDKLPPMNERGRGQGNSMGRHTSKAARGRAKRSEEYREARAEYEAIRKLRERNWIAAHIRERRYELGLTQQEVAARARTSHSFISKIEGGSHIPTIPVLERILAILDEQLLIGIERRVPNEEPERVVAPVPDTAVA